MYIIFIKYSIINFFIIFLMNITTSIIHYHLIKIILNFFNLFFILHKSFLLYYNRMFEFLAFSNRVKKLLFIFYLK